MCWFYFPWPQLTTACLDIWITDTTVDVQLLIVNRAYSILLVWHPYIWTTGTTVYSTNIWPFSLIIKNLHWWTTHTLARNLPTANFLWPRTQVKHLLNIATFYKHCSYFFSELFWGDKHQQSFSCPHMWSINSNFTRHIELV